MPLIGTGRTIAEKYFASHNRKNDENEPKYVNGAAELIRNQACGPMPFLEAGFLKPLARFEQGGMQICPTCCPRPALPHFSRPRGDLSYAMLTWARPTY